MKICFPFCSFDSVFIYVKQDDLKDDLVIHLMCVKITENKTRKYQLKGKTKNENLMYTVLIIVGIFISMKNCKLRES